MSYQEALAMFYLVQRLELKDRPEDEPSPMAPTRTAAGGFDAMFGCDYMGSSEFEFDAIPKAFEAMHKLSLSIRPVQLTRQRTTRTVFFVASDNPDRFDPALDEFRRWFASARLYSKERTDFEYYFSGEWPEYLHPGRTAAWWSLSDSFAWTLEEEIAKKLWCAFSGVPYT